MKKSYAPVLLFAAFLLAWPDASFSAVLRFGTHEIVLRSAASYDGAQGTPNPFTDVQLTAQVTAPSGKVYTVHGFFDGDGAGGQSGDVFKVRVFADETGTWQWLTASNAGGLNGQSGSFQVGGTLGGVFGQGPVEVHPQRPRAFRYRAGGAVYLLAKYLDRAAPANIQFSHTFLSEEKTDADREAFLTRHAGMKLNKINVYLANKGDYGGISTTPWLGAAEANDKTRFDLSRWRMYEQWIRRMRDDGFATQIWIFADGSGYGEMTDAQRFPLIRYAMARLSAETNTIFTLMTEWEEGWSATEVDSAMSELQARNPWKRLASVHGLPGDFAFPDAPWADHMVVQTGVETTLTPADIHADTLQNRSLANKPLMQEEFCLGHETDKHRQMAWGAFTAGAAGTGTGAFLRPLAEFIATVPFERMSPADSLVTSGAAWGLVETGTGTGKVYVFYLFQGGSISANLQGLSGTVKVDWFDPRTGTFQAGSAVAGGGARSFTAPGTGDWVLRLTGDAGGEPPPPADEGSFYTLTPCRLVDTRQAQHAPALVSSEIRQLDLTGVCGIPNDAEALSINVTVADPSAQGNLSFAPGGVTFTQTSTINFARGSNRANNALLQLAPNGSGILAVRAFVADGGPVHLILDVNGYFK